MTTQAVQFIQGKKKTKEELRLPQLHFVFCTDWVKKLGEKALFGWLQFYTFADRSNPDREVDVVPNSMNKIAKRLGVGKTTLYEQIIKPLWNYGFIDLQEFVHEGNTYVNIIVYEYPQNDPSLATKPLEKVRDYDHDYLSESRKKALKTAKKRKPTKPTQSQTRTTPSPKRGLPPVPNEDYPSPESGHNNVLNQSNVKNKSFNVSEYLSNLSSDKVKEWIQKQIQMDRLTDRKLKIIVNLYEEMKLIAEFSDALFISVCSNVLDYKQNNFKSYLKKSFSSALEVAQQQAAAQQPTTDDKATSSHPAYAVISPLLPRLTTLPKSIQWQEATQAVMGSFNVSWNDARKMVEEMNKELNIL